ncbi:MAG: CRISPR-associated endoribonuclease Cas6 [Cyclobacteriaceae bacterium]|nr:CRISPR-associated endoribonuclease Cas6 [Cyclobacteriaceae bacterium]
MRVRIVFTLKNRGGYVPFHHQFLLAQTIKGLIVLGRNEKFFAFTQYNFSGLKGQIKISRKGLHFYSSKVTLVFSTSDKEFLDYFISVLFAQKDLLVGALQLSPESVETEEPVAITDSVKFLCISPIVLVPASFNDESGKRFISPELDEFSDLLYDSTIARMEASGKYTPEQLADFYKFQLVADKEYINRIQQSHKKFARIYPLYDHDIKFEVRGYTFPFTLFAPQPVQQFVYENGLGHFSHKGFGMLDVANADSVKHEADLEATYA